MKSMQEKLQDFIKINFNGQHCPSETLSWWAGATAMAECFAKGESKRNALPDNLLRVVYTRLEKSNNQEDLYLSEQIRKYLLESGYVEC